MTLGNRFSFDGASNWVRNSLVYDQTADWAKNDFLYDSTFAWVNNLFSFKGSARWSSNNAYFRHTEVCNDHEVCKNYFVILYFFFSEELEEL